MTRFILLAAIFAALAIAAMPAEAQYYYGGRHFHPGRVGGFGYGGRTAVIYGNGWGLSLSFGGPLGGYAYSSGYPYYGGYGYSGYGYGGYDNPYPLGIYSTPGLGYLAYTTPPAFSPLVLPPLAADAADPLAEGVFPDRPDEAKPAEPKPPAVRASNLESRRRALHFTAAGDALFRGQRYHEALQKYKSASEAAPDMAESYMLQGFALLATSRYELAAAAFKRGLAVDATWADTPFRLDSIYGEAHASKDAHLERLIGALLEKPADADLIFVLAMFLRYDGDPDRAGRFFAKAAEIAGEDSLHLRPYLPEADVGRPAPEREAPLPDKAPRAVELPGVEA